MNLKYYDNGDEKIAYLANQVVLKVEGKTNEKELKEYFSNRNLRLLDYRKKSGWCLVGLSEEINEISFVNNIKKESEFVDACLNLHAHIEALPNDPYFTGTFPATYRHQWALSNVGQNPPSGSAGEDVNIEKAWDICQGDTNVVIAVLDTGIPIQNNILSHPDLDRSDRIIDGEDFTDLDNPNRDITLKDSNGHGTHVTGIIAAEINNDTGIAGVASDCKIMVFRVIDEFGDGSTHGLSLGIDSVVNYKIDHPEKKVIINFSITIPSANTEIEAALDNAIDNDIIFVACAGNTGKSFWAWDRRVQYPAKYSPDYDNILAVSAFDANGQFSAYSSRGSEVNVSAPGGYGNEFVNNTYYYNSTSVYGKNIFSTTPNYSFHKQYSTDMTQNYSYLAGTSMAAPLVSGIAGLILSVNPDLTASEVVNIIENTSEDDISGNGFDNKYGHGKVNAYEALKYTIENYGGTIGGLNQTITFYEDIILASSASLTISPGTSVKFATGKYLEVNGTLNANNVSFTNLSGNWGGIKYFNGSSGALTNCTISNSNYGVYTRSSMLDIENNSISNCSYGIYAYNASPDIESNEITNSRIYLNNSSAEFYDNLIEHNGAGSYFVRFYGSDPVLANNTISGEATAVVKVENVSIADFSGSFGGNTGKNIIEGQNEDFVVLVDDGSNVMLGNGEVDFPYFQNTILCDNGYAVANLNGNVMAKWCYWGGGSPNKLGTVNTDYYVSSPISGSGSSLSKSSNLLEPVPTFIEDKSEEKSLMDIAVEAEKEGDISKALASYKQIMVSFGKSKYAIQALSNVIKLCKADKTCNVESVLDYLLINVKEETLLGYVRARKVSHLRSVDEIEGAISLSEIMLDTYSDCKREETALFDLFNLYEKDMYDKEKADEYLNELKLKYPQSELTLLACEDMGEDVSDFKLAKYNLADFDEEEIIVPAEFKLEAAYPNPFNPSTNIDYALPLQSDVSCTIYNLSGHEVKSYHFNQPAGNHNIIWNASDVSSGIYLVRFVAKVSNDSETFTDYQKITLLK
jgi:parallel beta-helix repeat protein